MRLHCLTPMVFESELHGVRVFSEKNLGEKMIIEFTSDNKPTDLCPS